MDRKRLLDLYQVMLTSRRMDELEQEITNRGEAFFHVASSGHESVAALAYHLHSHDWLHCHYRDRAVLLARGIRPEVYFSSLYAKDDSTARGRRMCCFLNDPQLHVLSMTTPTANNALQSVGVAAAVRDLDGHPVVYCGNGDGSTQQGEFLEACAEAARRNLPVLFLVQDNRYAISTHTTGKTFFSLPDGLAREFMGIPIRYIDGRDAVATYQAFGEVVADMRQDRKPAIVVMSVERLTSHTNADDQTAYRTAEEIAAAADGDPVRTLENYLLDDGVTRDQLQSIRADVDRVLERADAIAMSGPEPDAKSSLISKRPLNVELTHPSRENRVESVELESPLRMRDALRESLRHHLRNDERVVLLGEDIEDPKGDVFGVTKTLSTEFPGRVINSPLTESTIIGTSIGRAVAGERPVAFLQFADFMPQAYNQLASELGNMFWRTDGQYQAPVIVMVACGAYRPGLGPYHAQTYDSVLTHIPGLDVFMPATADDAAGMLNVAFESDRPTIVLYPKSRLNDESVATTADVTKSLVPIGVGRKVRSGRDLTLVGWGNTVNLCERVADTLETSGAECEVIDLRSLSPWDEHMVLSSAEKTARMLVVHEDNHTCGLGGEVLATVAERARMPVAVRRVTRPDTYIPCNFGSQLEVIPSYKRVLEAAAELLDFDIRWNKTEKPADGLFHLEAIGSGPADESVVVVEWLVEPGDAVKRGDAVCTVEATKSVFEITCPTEGVIRQLLFGPGDAVPVGEAMATLVESSELKRPKPVSKEEPGVPILTRRKSTTTVHLPRRNEEQRKWKVSMSHIVGVTGSRLVKNAELELARSSMSSADIVRRTGIEQRFWVNEGESAVDMAVRSASQLLVREDLRVDDLDVVICSTTSPTSVTPSMACQVLNGLCNGRSETMLQAFDINAACSGYLYALQSGYDYLQSTPTGRVLVVTAEVLSPLLDPNDFDTAILFGDATSATILYGEEYFECGQAQLFRPDLSAKGEDGSSLSVPFRSDGYIQMKGKKVFAEAVRAMVGSLSRVCQRQGMAVDELDLVVPHQANQRIIDAIQNRIQPAVYSNIRLHGNTSSSSIPLCLQSVIPATESGNRIGLCAFGGGFTFGAGIIQRN